MAVTAGSLFAPAHTKHTPAMIRFHHCRINVKEGARTPESRHYGYNLHVCRHHCVRRLSVLCLRLRKLSSKYHSVKVCIPTISVKFDITLSNFHSFELNWRRNPAEKKPLGITSRSYQSTSVSERCLEMCACMHRATFGGKIAF